MAALQLGLKHLKVRFRASLEAPLVIVVPFLTEYVVYIKDPKR